MIEHLCVFTKGGRVLWNFTFAGDRSFNAPVNDLVRLVLLEERASRSEYETDAYGLRWAFDNSLELVYVVVYNKGIAPPYTGELLTQVASAFSATYADKIKDTAVLHSFDGFDKAFGGIRAELEEKAAKPARQRSYAEAQKGKAAGGATATSKAAATAAEPTSPKSPTSPKQLDDRDDSPAATSPTSTTLSKEDIAKLLLAKGRIKGAKKEPVVEAPAPAPTGKKPKQMAESKRDVNVVTKKAMAALDYSNSKGVEDSTIVEQFIDRNALAEIKSKAGSEYQVSDLLVKEDDEQEDDQEEEQQQKQAVDSTRPVAAPAGTNSGIFGFFKGLVGQKVLERSDLDPALHGMKEHLINKNVAESIADNLCASLRESLIGQKVSSFKGLNTLVKESMEPALQRILTPKKSTDLLRDILAAKAEKRPFSIVFCGVNGVGKSTNLAKICFWLLQNKLRILIAACDTFRSGAVEQLRVHVRNLKSLDLDGQGAATENIELYEKGYGKEAALIAKDAIGYAKTQKFDVVLVDTAGRMQDNEPLMRALARLVKVNDPDKVVFVGEALVGNDGVDQLVKFNAALKDFSDLADPRQIDGIVLTKFDTIDDKVGAALSMTYITGQPIFFVGTGQTYTDLKKMNVKAVVQSLLL